MSACREGGCEGCQCRTIEKQEINGYELIGPFRIGATEMWKVEQGSVLLASILGRERAEQFIQLVLTAAS